MASDTTGKQKNEKPSAERTPAERRGPARESEPRREEMSETERRRKRAQYLRMKNLRRTVG